VAAIFLAMIDVTRWDEKAGVYIPKQLACLKTIRREANSGRRALAAPPARNPETSVYFFLRDRNRPFQLSGVRGYNSKILRPQLQGSVVHFVASFAG
jgi:hypothetical protein